LSTPARSAATYTPSCRPTTRRASIATESTSHRFLLIGGLQNLETAHECLIDAHHGPRIVELAAVVGRREQRHKLPVAEELISVFDDLVRPADQVNLVLVVELSHDVFSEREANTSVVVAPVLHFFVGVGPEKVTQESSVRHVCGPHDVIDGEDFVEFGR